MKSLVSAAAVILLVSGCSALDYAPTPAAPPPIAPAAPTEVPPNAIAATSLRVHDGDTLWVTMSDGAEVKVRMTGIDTPEVGDNLECYGDEATALLTALASAGTPLWLEADTDPVDKYGRSLFYVFGADGTLLNLAMVQQGAAEALVIGDNDRYYDVLLAAEDAARAGGVGMWGSC